MGIAPDTERSVSWTKRMRVDDPGDLCNEVLTGCNEFTELPAVGAGGRSDKGLPPLSSFEESLE